MSITPILGRPNTDAPVRTANNRPRIAAPRRSLPRLVLGILLVAASIAAAVLWSTTTGDRRLALALINPITLGEFLGADDLREVSVALDGSVDAIPAEEAGTVVGRSVATSLPAGVLLPRAALGPPTRPDPGDAIAALALQPGQVPPDVFPGAHVLVVLSTSDASSSQSPSTTVWPAVVTDVSGQQADRALVVSVQLAEHDARQVAASPIGDLSLVLIAGEGGR